MIDIDILNLVVSVLGLISALVTLYIAWRIPHLIMIQQRFTELLSEYRSTEMGDAILSILDFFYNDCEDNNSTDHNKIDSLINEKYIERYKYEVKNKLCCHRNKVYSGGNNTNKDEPKDTGGNNTDKYEPKDTLHFKRRLVDHLFWLIADLRFNPEYPVKLSKKQVRQYFDKNERYLLHILYHMNKAAESKECRIDASSIDKCNCGCDKWGDSPMALYREKLYKESECWGGSHKEQQK